MTTAEIIHVYENGRLQSDNFTPAAVTAAYLAGLSALHEKSEREVNNPLTLDELREMDGEPVYSPRLQEWGIVAAGGFAFTNMVYICDKAGNLRPATVWLACGPVYRRKREEALKHG